MVNSDTIVVTSAKVGAVSDTKANRGKLVAYSGTMVVNSGKLVVNSSNVVVTCW